jgi:hypothetical protein
MEAKFITNFLSSHALDEHDVQHAFAPGDITMDDLPQEIHKLYDTIAEFASPSNQQSHTDGVVWFNIRGESLCLFRSTILKVIPDSQLAIRVGGEWVEQSSTLDKEGRIIVVRFIHSFIHSFFHSVFSKFCLRFE